MAALEEAIQEFEALNPPQLVRDITAREAEEIAEGVDSIDDANILRAIVYRQSIQRSQQIRNDSVRL